MEIPKKRLVERGAVVCALFASSSCAAWASALAETAKPCEFPGPRIELHRSDLRAVLMPRPPHRTDVVACRAVHVGERAYGVRLGTLSWPGVSFERTSEGAYSIRIETAHGSQAMGLWRMVTRPPKKKIRVVFVEVGSETAPKWVASLHYGGDEGPFAEARAAPHMPPQLIPFGRGLVSFPEEQ